MSRAICSTDFSVMSGLRWPFGVEIGSYHGCAGHPMQHRNTKSQAQKNRGRIPVLCTAFVTLV
ncbi:MAG: hypothetical protein E2581_06985 [Pseudomonas sp.]|nr:hypothetical protein [Pseudomonas sp.]